MQPHPDFADSNLPRHMVLGDVSFTPLSPDVVDEDFEAVVATAPLLTGVFGTWPAGLTRADNAIDLAWHEREFTSNRSFSWIVRDDTGTYIGCFYIYPEIGSRGQATAVLWLCDMVNRNETALRLKKKLTAWMGENLPAGYDVTWVSSPMLDP